MTKSPKPEAPTVSSGAAIAVFGMDDTGKPHAGRFAAEEAAAARKAADALNLKVLDLNSKERSALGEQLPAGKLYATGKAFLPFVRVELFDRLISFLEGATQPNGQQTSTESDAATTESAASSSGSQEPIPATIAAPLAIPRSWDEIRVGSLVLGHEGAEEGWWEAVVTDIKGEDLTIRWRDFPDQVPMIVSKRDVAFLP